MTNHGNTKFIDSQHKTSQHNISQQYIHFLSPATSGGGFEPSIWELWGAELNDTQRTMYHIFLSIVRTFLHWKWYWNIPCAYIKGSWDRV